MDAGARLSKAFTMVMASARSSGGPAGLGFLSAEQGDLRDSESQFEETVDELSSLLEIKDLLDVPVKKLSLASV